MASVSRVPEFDAAIESFGAYSRRLEQYFVANGVGEGDAPKRRAILLSAVGASTFSLLEDLIAPASAADKSFQELVKILTDHFEPQQSPIVSRFRFHSCTRDAGESVSSFLARLRKLAKPCKFESSQLDEMLRDRLVCGIQHERLQSRLLSEPRLTLVTAVEIAQAHESAAASAAELSGRTESADVIGRMEGATLRDRRALETDVRRSAGRGQQTPATDDQRPGGRGGATWRPPPPQRDACGRCRSRRHTSAACPFRSRSCFACGAIGHTRAACRSGAGSQRVRLVAEDEEQLGTAGSARESSADDAPEYDGETEPYFLFHATSAQAGLGRKPPLLVDVSVDGHSLRMELDTGAALSVCSQKAFKRVWPEGGPEIQPCDKVLKTYSGEILELCGQAMVDVRYGEQCARLPLIVVRGEGPFLFGRNWLHHVRLDWPSICHMTTRRQAQSVATEFSEVFSDGLGCYRGAEVNISVDPDVKPRFFKARTVPLAYREQVDAELERQIQQGLWEPVKQSKWAAPLVVAPKPGGKIRLCGDYRLTVNRVAKGDQYPLPRVEELLTGLVGSTVFSKIDLKSAYNQLVLDEDSREILTVNTPRGLLRPTRLSFGYASAPSLFQRTMDTLLAGIKGVCVFLDDVVVAGETTESHEKALREVLRRFSEAGLKANEEKCCFGVDSLTYLGYKISGRGVETTEDKVAAITGAPEPRDVAELRCWLGLINYYGKFLQGLASTLSPLYALLRQNHVWRWTQVERKAFEDAKRLLRSPPVLAHFDPKLPVILACDASPVGLGCILSQKTRQGERPIAFYSRSLNDTEKRYSQTDREGLAVVAGVKKFHYYLAGRPFSIRTDHKPLLGLIGEMKPLPQMASPRVVRWALMLSAYDYHLEYVPGVKQSHCDALSRLPLPTGTKSSPAPAETIHLMEFLDASPVTVDQIRLWTARDPVLSVVTQYVRDGWPTDGEMLSPPFRPYRSRKTELSLQDGCILWGCRVVVPPQGRDKVLRLLHDGHCGETRTKSFARMYVWWPNLDEDITSISQRCGKCQSTRANVPNTPVHPWVWPSKPWERVHIDYCGPIDGWMFLIITDAHSKWMDIYPSRTSTSEVTVEHLRASFAAWGLPKTLVSDNAQCFMSDTFQNFCRSNGIVHLTSPALSPKSNGLAERSVQTFKAGLRKQTVGSLHTKIARFLMRYRATPHTTTQVSPAELFLGRSLRTPLDLIKPDLSGKVRKQQDKQKQYADRGTKVRTVRVGDAVFVSSVDRVQGALGCKWLAGVIVEQKGVKLAVQLQDGRVIWRHLDRVRPRRLTFDASVPPAAAGRWDREGAAAPDGPPPPSAAPPEPRYNLRPRDTLRGPDRLQLEP